MTEAVRTSEMVNLHQSPWHYSPEDNHPDIDDFDKHVI
jgi:hypothetical protein